MLNDNDLIRRGDLKDLLLKRSFFPAIVAAALKEIPAVDAVEVVHGDWVLGRVEPGYFTPGGNRPWLCSECEYLASWMLGRPTYNYCPNCGADMRERKDDGK